MDQELRRQVWDRAGGVCEYCHMPHALTLLPFEIDHIIAQQHKGPTTAENLALACWPCNKHKGPNLSGIDPLTGKLTRLFHPRRDVWSKHFSWAGPELLGLTDVGR